jgi:hypothetical protein
MVTLLSWAAAALGGLGAALVVVLTVRRLSLAGQTRETLAAETRLRPLALALVEGDPVDLRPLDEREAHILAALLARYGRWLTGSSRVHIAAFFEATGRVVREIEALADRRSWRRATAAYVLGDMASNAAIPPLLDALTDDEREVRAAAARALGRLGASEAVEPLVYALASRRVPKTVAGQALLAIGPSAVAGLRKLATHPDAEVRAVAIELIGLLGDAAEAPELVERLRDTSAEVRAKAARALGRLGADEAAAELRVALDDRIPFVRVAAAFALGAIGDRRAAGRLFVIAKDDQFDPAQAAARALMRIDPELTVAAADSGAGPHLVEAADLLAAGR